jgi:hypothetical protein
MKIGMQSLCASKPSLAIGLLLPKAHAGLRGLW